MFFFYFRKNKPMIKGPQKGYNRYTPSIAPGQSVNALNTFSRMNTLRSSNNTFNRMRSRQQLRHGPSQMSIASYAVGDFGKGSNQVIISFFTLQLLIRDISSTVDESNIIGSEL